MDWIYRIVQILVLFLTTLWFFTWLCERKSGTGWTRELKRQLAARWISRRKRSQAKESSDSPDVMAELIDGVQQNKYDSNVISFYCSDQKNNFIFLRINRRKDKNAELQFYLGLEDGRCYELPDHPNTVVSNFGNSGWSGAGFKITVLEPLTRMRIIFNGLLRKGCRMNFNDNADIDVEHVRLNCIFIANCRPISRDEFWSSKLQADTLARNTWNKFKWQQLINKLDNEEFDQYGSLLGQATFEDLSMVEFYLRGLRQSYLGKYDGAHFERNVCFAGLDPLGFSFYVNLADIRDGLKNMRLGHLKEPAENLYAIDALNLTAKEFMDNYEKGFNEYKLEFTAGDRKYVAVIKLNKKNQIRKVYGGYPWDSLYTYCNFELKLNDSSGVGMVHIWQPYLGSCSIKLRPIKRFLRATESNDNTQVYALPFEDKRCQSEKLVGGKGASLAELTAIETTQFTVPRGFCVTAHALNAHIKYHANLEETIDEFVQVCNGEKVGVLKEHSEKVVALMQSTPVLHTVQTAILEMFEALELGDEKCTFAVRSSAVGEDNEDTSAAGQNSTYLGIKDANQVIKYVAHCWASLFTHQSVEYRRQHGLAIKASMGVCVQQMVEAEVAGVMFTRHPITGNPKEIMITSNYGLGETVVSALVDPDTLIIERRPDGRNWLSVKTSMVGKKLQKITLDSEGGGTRHQALSEREISELSLSPELALRLAEIGADLDELYNAPRDLEWAVSRGRIFLLQCRPVTAIDTWTDFELTHELGSGVPCESDIITFANVGEVLPMAITPLTLSSVVRGLNLATESALSRKPLAFNCYSNHVFIVNMRCTLNYLNLLLRYVDDKITLGQRVMEIAVSGRSILTPEIHETAKTRNGVLPFGERVLFNWNMLMDLWHNLGSVQEAEEIVARCREWPLVRRLDDLTSPKEIYEELERLMDEFAKVCRCHNHTSKSSIFYQVLIMSILTEGSEDFTMEHYSDIAVLLGSCSDAISAQVPIVLKEITHTIKESGLSEQFKNIDVSDAINWLLTNCPKAYEQVQEFIKVHGYRGIEEFDLITETWGMKPEKFLATIQSMMSTSGDPGHSPPKKDLSPSETVGLLKSPRKRITRWILRALLPASRMAVVRRETTKALTIELVHHLRLGYRRLASLLTKQGILPYERLVFFLTHRELGEIMREPRPTLLRKAARRCKLRPRLQRHKYLEVNVGMPKPVVMTKIANKSKGALVQGTLVCNGLVTGRACVALTLEEATEIKLGDILVTNATDIGWSPYFPLLSGVVTELGGLISHGAVVAREYGLPCIVSAENATRIIRTGEIVTLNGYTGTLEVVDESLLC